MRTNCVHRVHHVQRGARDGHGLLIAALTALVRAPFGRGSEGLRYLPCGAVAADLEQMAQPEALQHNACITRSEELVTGTWAADCGTHGLGTRAPFGRGSEGLRYLPCGAVAADLEQTAQPEASQRLWF